jgi:hypothetical protein
VSYRALRRRPRGWLKDRGVLLWAPLPGYAFQDRSSTPSTAAAHGDPLGTVTEWTGAGGAAVAPSDAARPVLKNSAPLWYGDYDGSDDNLQVAVSSLAGDVTLARACLPTNFSAARCLASQASGGTANPNDWYLASGTGVPTFARGNGSASASLAATSAPSTSTPSVLRVQQAGTAADHALNGAGNNSGRVSTTVADAGQPMNLGRRADGSALFLGKVYATAAAPSALSATDARHLDVFLGALAGLQL